ncbi:threonine/serine dehydratase [Myceligenerans pegani]|uniref:Pyridoxal-phosphate dependent enzyme n=1 Tax=Myceligenerans pegani TaxID=2776917 RepID=A0ABR9MVV4_9MICO|nr:pyridoxal-phosphate dependent enzyme [Myceligenerans sp. TRM 65318]MBE1874897.1 pyridoxal-phosphate dependent enzyme [Myceligenerans sp. TRM 65318]MBE3017168.1 pyridoxal-phosphate dependent enzyme [Myceligenerans sp. TRM 65318]
MTAAPTAVTATAAQAAPGMRDVLSARARIEHLVVRTPATSYPELDAATGAHVVVKHENLQHTGSFKVRGALNLLLSMTPGERERGVVAYSTGNHAQAQAYAARHTGAPATIVMPAGPTPPNPLKVRAVRALGARLELAGRSLTEAAGHAAHLAARDGARLVSAANEPALVAGVATGYLELLQQTPDLDALVVPVGGGSGAAAACLVAAAIAPHLEVIGVQSDAAPAAHDSWRCGELVERPAATRAEGLATGAGFSLTQSVLREHLADFLLVSDDEISAAQYSYLTAARTVAEGAGAAALAAVVRYPERFAGRRVGVVCSGGNASGAELRRALGEPAATPLA